MSKRQTRHHGFTLVELLVAISITLLMLGLVNMIFFESSRLVGTGIATSKIVAASRSVNNQLDLDARYIQGPDALTNGGFLVILNQQVSADVRDGAGGTKSRNVRSDQLVFIRTNNSPPNSPFEQLTPISPSSTSGYAADGTTPTGFVRIWYGHVHQTMPNGLDWRINSNTDDPSIPADSRLGDTGILASNWILGRQALFLITGATSIHANTADAGGLVDGYGTPITSGGHPTNLYNADVAPGSFTPALPGSAGPGLQLYMGIADIADQVLDNPAAPPNGVIQTIVGTGYPTAAYAYTFGTKRLRANPTPDYDSPDAVAPSEYSYASWQIAQMHPILMENASDFVVEFAGDYDGLPGIDTDGTNPSSPLPDNDTNGIPYTYSGGNIKWYSHYFNDPSVPGPPPGGTYDSTRPAVYPPPPGGNGFEDGLGGLGLYAQAPIYDTTAARPPLSDAALVFRHDDDGAGVNPSRWPYMIRIRYRLHDTNGRLRDSDGELGKWFEHVIKVRPF